jgi:hypothetical protein
VNCFIGDSLGQCISAIIFPNSESILKTNAGGAILKKEIMPHDKTKLLEKELATLTEKLEAVHKDLQETKELRNEIKGLKLFLGRVYPEFKTWFPEIMQKVYKKSK